MKTKLTQRIVDAAQPKEKPYEIHDADLRGLLLRVQPSGIKSYVVLWGRGQRRTLGKHPVMTVAGARAAALEALLESAKHGAPLAVIESRKPVNERPITLGDFIREHFAPWVIANRKAGQATVNALNACFDSLYSRGLREISSFDIERFKTARRKAGIKPATVNRDLDRIRKVFSCAVDWGFLSEHPIKKVKRIKVDNERVRYLSDGEEERLREALSERERERRRHRESGNEWCKQRGGDGRPVWPDDGFTDHVMPIVLLALNTGLRRGELFGLDWRSVNLSAKLLTVEAGNAKTEKTRHIPLNAEALDVLSRWKKQHGGTGLVFPSPTGGRLGHINSSWASVVETAQLAGFHFHDFRHDFASKLVMAGVDLNTVRELMGHADIKMTLRYAHLAPGRLAAAVAKLDKVGG